MDSFQLRTSFFEHPKALQVGAYGRDLFLASLAYSVRNETDGFVPEARITQFPLGIRHPTRVARLLVSVGLFDQVNGGFVVHDFPDYQETRAELESKRARDRTRKARARLSVRPESVRVDSARSPADLSVSVSDQSVRPSLPIELTQPDEFQNSTDLEVELQPDEFPIAALMAEIRDADLKTLQALRYFRARLPESEFWAKREKLIEARQRTTIRSEAKYVVRALDNALKERRG